MLENKWDVYTRTQRKMPVCLHWKEGHLNWSKMLWSYYKNYSTQTSCAIFSEVNVEMLYKGWAERQSNGSHPAGHWHSQARQLGPNPVLWFCSRAAWTTPMVQDTPTIVCANKVFFLLPSWPTSPSKTQLYSRMSHVWNEDCNEKASTSDIPLSSPSIHEIRLGLCTLNVSHLIKARFFLQDICQHLALSLTVSRGGSMCHPLGVWIIAAKSIQ